MCLMCSILITSADGATENVLKVGISNKIVFDTRSILLSHITYGGAAVTLAVCYESAERIGVISYAKTSCITVTAETTLVTCYLLRAPRTAVVGGLIIPYDRSCGALPHGALSNDEWRQEGTCHPAVKSDEGGVSTHEASEGESS